MSHIRAGIVGGAGYTGGELIRVLLRHPAAEIVWVQSSSQAGRRVSEVHADLEGETGMRFCEAPGQEVDVLFLCLRHGESRPFLSQINPGPAVRVIDLSQDFRLESEGFVYGLPEMYRERIRTASRIANPGCFATAIQLALLPLAREGHLKQPVHVSAITGSTGAGQAPTPTTHFSWRFGNLSVYEPFRHRHLQEIRHHLGIQEGPDIRFLPFRGSFTRGILATCYTETDLSLEAARELYNAFYASHPFVHCTPRPVDLKQVVNTNRCLIYLEKHQNILLIIAALDNLLKGASGQAVQNMNLLFGLDETTGLLLKSVAF